MGDFSNRFASWKNPAPFLTVTFLLFSAPSVFWGGNVFRVVNAANQSCQAIDTSVKSNALPVEYLVEATGEGPSTWRKFESPEDAKKAFPGGSLSNATVYFGGDSPVRVDCETKSPTKEWVQYARYYFREDGTLQKTHSDFRRFGAYEREKGMEQEFLVKVLRDKYYDSKGKMVKKTSPRFFNTSNGREMKDVVFTDGPWPVYSRTKMLPFYDLLLKSADTPEKTRTPSPGQ
jgi:hypothetical protein